MKLKGLSLVLPLADLRPLCAPASRLHFLSPFAAKPSRTYLKDFGVCKERKLRIPWRPVETIFFECNRAVSLPLRLPDGAPVTRFLRRAYLDDTVAMRFDLSIFANPLHRGPASAGTPETWGRKFWNTPLSLRGSPTRQISCSAVPNELKSRFIDASSVGLDVGRDLVDCLAPILIIVVQASEAELSAEYVPLDRKPTLFCRTFHLQFPGTPDLTTILSLAHLSTEYFRPKDAAFQPLRKARSFVAWLHTELQVLESLTRRMHAFPNESGLLLGTVEVLADSLLAASQRAEDVGLHIGGLESLFASARDRVGASLEGLGLRECAEKLRAALPSKKSAHEIQKVPAETFSGTPPKNSGSASQPPRPLDELLQSAITTYASSLTGEVSSAAARYDDADFRDSARRKAQEVHVRLPKSSYVRPPIIVSIGGANGAELFELLNLTGSRHGVLLEFSHSSTDEARREAAKRELCVEIITGDAMQKVGDAMSAARRMSASQQDAPVIVTMMAILHELPSRSPGFQFVEYFYKLKEASVIIGREPVDPVNWSQEVLLEGAFSADRFVTLASIVTGKLHSLPGGGRNLGGVTAVSRGRVKGHRGLVLETLVKALYAEDILYEMQERFTTIREEDLLRHLETCFDDTHHISCDLLTSKSISTAWRSFGLIARAADDSHLLAKPASHIWYEATGKQFVH